MVEGLECWRCGASLDEVPLPLGRREECPACGADLHVCRMCRFYDTTVARACREPIAEPVADKTRANFCGYLEPRPGAHGAGRDEAGGAARAELAALFGLDGEALGEEGGESPEERARRELERLFGKGSGSGS